MKKGQRDQMNIHPYKAFFVSMNSRVYVKTEHEYLAKIQVVQIIKHQTEFLYNVAEFLCVCYIFLHNAT